MLTENYAALPIVQQELHKKSEEPVVIFGSNFPKDQEYTQVLTAVLKVIKSVVTREMDVSLIRPSV